jgi:omega-amidase
MKTADLAETMNGRTHQIMTDTAIERKCSVGGSIIIKEDNKYFNRFILVDAAGNTHTYDKRHLFTMGMEDKYYAAGNKQTLVSVNGIQLMPLICYDLRFPVWSRNKHNYDVLIYVANWPKVRQYVWETLLKARAIENQCYVIGVNRTGKDGNNIEYLGGSRIVNARGHVVGNLTSEEDVLNYTLDLEDLYAFRKKFPVLPDADNFKLIR